MDAVIEHTVILPDARKVRVSGTPMAWWSEDGASGHVKPELIAPDPDQPREHMNPAELAELTVSIKERGVREPLTVTPMALAPWVKVAPEHKDLPFVVVSGHRRRRGSLDAEVKAVPIRVVVYANEQDYLLDASVLNNNHSGLTPIEEGREIVRLRGKGVTLEKIAKSRGRSVVYVYGRIALTRLDPAIQQLLDPKLPVKQRLPIGLASELGSVEAPTVEEMEEMLVIFKTDIQASSLVGDARPTFAVEDMNEDELRFQLQKVLLSVITRRSLNASRASEFIKEHEIRHQEARGKKTHVDRFEPRKRKEILFNLAGSVTGSTVIEWTPKEFERIFESALWEEAERFRSMIYEAGENLTDIAKLLKRICDNKIRAMREQK